MARGQAGQQQQQAAPSPEYVVVRDNEPVEPVDTSKRYTRIAIVAGLVIVPLILGITVGQISSSANVYNQSIEDAEFVRDDVRRIGSGLVEVQNTLLIGKERGEDETYLPHDEELVEDLGALDVVQPNPDVVYNSYLYELEPRLVEDVFSFYTQTRIFYEDLHDHVRQSENDAQLLERSASELEDLTPLSYGAYVSIPDGDDASGPEALPHVEIVEVGEPVCDDGEPREACPGAPVGFQYRTDPSGPWGEMDITDPNNPELDEGELFLLGENPLFESFVAGSDERLATRSYLQRLRDLEERLNDLLERRSQVEDDLSSWANESPRFTFFL